MLSEPIRTGEARLEERIEELRREVIRLGRIIGGPGIKVSSTPGGIAISAATPAEVRAGGKKDVSGTPKVLGQTQGTQDIDTYDRDTDAVPVQFDVITDAQYDEGTHKLTYRTRTIVAVGILSVSAESALVEITTAVECPCVDA